MKNELRIIGGQWRSRKIQFPDKLALRPTPNRIRETLFNWLAPGIHYARCLDLFAGSGALGFEALSRGAKEVIFVETDPTIVQCLRANHEHLGGQAEIICQNANDYLTQALKPFNIVFLDPPFHQHWIDPICKTLHDKQLVLPGGYVYLETERNWTTENLPNSWQVAKQKQTGQVQYILINVTP